MSNKTSRHTPGPWKINAYGEVADCNNDGIAEILYRSPERTDEALAEEAANAHLIAVAPELLAACELGEAMRAAQRVYFKDRTQANLITSKQAEAAFDKAVAMALSKATKQMEAL